MSGVNLAVVVGFLGDEPSTRDTATSKVTTFDVATSEKWKDKSTGEDRERTEWHRIKCFGRLAEVAAEYLAKSSRVYVRGSIRSDAYTDKDGVKRWSHEIVADDIQFLDRAPQGEAAL